ncbi:hypothetical protein GWI33_014939 [Rhynchophorus ferrugineus]|uniref:Uncharacterized protein n=1 Tax=Rhynchophorus ferrugineus TaxID=354439 RepID=A0A834M8L2_RHYFE|nr:hypothetical protein GWI33_014939 [Rhynchophorus ferrugineus]
MRSNGTAQGRAFKPPPPVPPRPSKTLVQEALAKTRNGNETAPSDPIMGQNKTKSPMRQAPPPPAGRGHLAEISKSFSSGQVNVALKKQAPQPTPPVHYYERSISVDKVSSRPVVYQSDNAKKAVAEVQRRNSDVKRVDSLRKAGIERNDSMKIESMNNNRTVELKRIECFRTDRKAEVIVKKPSLKRTSSAKSDNIDCLIIKTSEDVKETDLGLIKEANYSLEHTGYGRIPWIQLICSVLLLMLNAITKDTTS